jgi:DUF4097 and DUF4098 domain-containing protein YvlB
VPTFDTPEAVPVELDLVVADVTITATDRTDTVVDVRPTDPASDADLRAAEQTQVELTAGRILVRQPRQKRLIFGRPGSIDLTVELPTGAPLQAKAAVGTFHATGELGDSRFRNSTGDIRLDRVGALDLRTSAGGIAVDHVTGRAEISTSSGELRVRRADGPAELKNSNGGTWIGAVGGDLKATASNGDITIGRAGGSVGARTANGKIQIAELVRGTANLKSGFGGIDVAVRPGTAVRLDLYTNFGKVRNGLDSTDGPAGAGDTAELEVRTSFGDITIRRAEHDATGQEEEL